MSANLGQHGGPDLGYCSQHSASVGWCTSNVAYIQDGTNLLYSLFETILGWHKGLALRLAQGTLHLRIALSRILGNGTYPVTLAVQSCSHLLKSKFHFVIPRKVWQGLQL